MHVFTDRSRIETGYTCPRKRFLNYHYRGRGIELARQIPPPWALWTGSATHIGLQQLMEGAAPQLAALSAADQYAEQIKPLYESLEDGSELKIAMLRDGAEQVELVMALVYAWGLVKLPLYKEQFEPVAVEREEEITFQVGDDEVTL